MFPCKGGGFSHGIVCFRARVADSRTELFVSVRESRFSRTDRLMWSAPQPTDSAHQKNFDPIFASNSKTAHFERKRWAPPFKPCPRGVHWWWSRPNWLSWRREPWLGPSKKCHLGPLWMEGKNCPRGSEKLMGTARGDRGSGIFFSAPELKN